MNMFNCITKITHSIHSEQYNWNKYFPPQTDLIMFIQQTFPLFHRFTKKSIWLFRLAILQSTSVKRRNITQTKTIYRTTFSLYCSLMLYILCNLIEWWIILLSSSDIPLLAPSTRYPACQFVWQYNNELLSKGGITQTNTLYSSTFSWYCSLLLYILCNWIECDILYHYVHLTFLSCPHPQEIQLAS